MNYLHMHKRCVATAAALAGGTEDARKPWAPAEDKVVTAVDFYAGIGGNHFAFDEACAQVGLTPKVLMSVEINDLANHTYRHNFPGTKVRQSSIEGVKQKELEKVKADVWLASPPCQPYTRNGLLKGSDDPRSNSFFHLLAILEKMHHSVRPGMLFIENVKNFEESNTHAYVVGLLPRLGYDVRQFLLNPNQMGVPNSRLRYFLVARRVRGSAGFLTLGTVAPLRTHLGPSTAAAPAPSTLRDVLGDVPQLAEYELPQKQVCSALARVLDVTFPHNTNSMCFTKGYAQYAEGTGSMMCCNVDSKEHWKALVEQHDECCPARDAAADGGADAADAPACPLMALRVRRFAPLEIARIMCFPSTFGFHKDASTRQQYRLLGNSVCVATVQAVLEELLSWPADEPAAAPASPPASPSLSQ